MVHIISPIFCHIFRVELYISIRNCGLAALSAEKLCFSGWLWKYPAAMPTV